MSQVIQVSLEAKTEKLLKEIETIRISTERQSRKDIVTELSKLKGLYNKQLDEITTQLKDKVDQEAAFMEITESQSEQIKELKGQLETIKLKQEQKGSSSEKKNEA
eukprot:scaffold303554_cov66-Cyclotella_meneghiniana.AAC.1